MATKDNEYEQLRTVALQNAKSILLARRRAEETLRKQSEWLQVTLSSIGDAVISTDADSRITFMNGVAESLTGWSLSETMGQPLQEVLHIIEEKTRLRIENLSPGTLSDRTIVGLANHTILIARDGTEWPIDDSMAPIRNEQGEVAGLVLVFRDITERKREETAQGERNRLVALRADVSTALASGQATTTALQQCCTTLVRHLEVAFAGIWTLNDSINVLESQAQAGLKLHLNELPNRVPVGQFNIGRIAASREPYLTNAVPDDPNVSNQEWARRERICAFAGYPLMVEDRVVGVVAMFARHALTKGVLTELEPLADAIAQYIDRRNAAERFRHQAALHRVTLASIGDAVLTTDANGNVSFLNNAAQTLTGWTQEEAHDKPLTAVFKIINEASRQPVDNPVERVLREGKVIGLSNHTILISRDGTERPIDDSAAPIRDDNGRVVGVVLVFHDTTERRQAEKNTAFLDDVSHELASLLNIDDIIQTVGERLGAYLNLSACAFIEINEDAYAAIVTHDWHRDGAKSLAGVYRIDEFVSKEFQRAGRDGETFVVRDTLADSRTVGERFTPGNVRSFVSVPLIRDGQWRFVFVIFDSKAHDWRPDEVELMRELTSRIWARLERARAEEALRSSEARFRAAVEVVSSLIWTNNADGMMEGEQPGWENFTGQKYEDYQGYGWSKAVHPEDAQPTIGAWEQAVTEKKNFEFEHRLRRRDGEWRLCSIRAVPVFTDKDEIREWVGVHTDITDRRRTEEELKDADRRKNEFLAILAHELRNPLAPIRNALEIARRTRGNGQAVKSAFEIMERQIRQMVRLVDDLLDVNRISQGKIELRRELVELASAIDQAVETCRPTLESAGHKLIVKMPAQPVYLYADPVRLAQAFGNLLNNACKYTEPGGHISVVANLRSDDVMVVIRDTGIGIPAEMLRNVFEIFAQVDRSLERSQGGLGIGLTLVKELVEMHGGRVEARSDGAGKGSEFIVYLPISSRLPDQLPQAQTTDVARPNKHITRRILVVDDNQDSAESLVILLRTDGHEVHTAQDGLEAVDLALSVRPDIVLLDIGLPKLNGFEAARRIREEIGPGEMVLVALTGWGQEEDRRRSKEAGFDHHLTKPVEFDTLNKLIAGLDIK